MGLNDDHGNVEAAGAFGISATAPAPAADRPPVGGADFLAAHMASLEKQIPLNVVFGVGDLIGTARLYRRCLQTNHRRKR